MKKLLSLTLCLTSLAAVPLSAGAAGTGGLPPTDFPGTAAVLTGQIARVTREELSRRAALPVAPDEQGELTFQNLHRRVREGNATMLSVDQQLARLNAMDREQAFDDLVSAYNAMTDMLFNYAKMGSTMGAMAGAANPLLSTYNMMDTSFSSAYLQSQQAQLETQLDALKPEEYAETYRESVWQIETGQKQILAGAESLYITILSLERTLEDGNRGLATLDRTLTEMEKRYELGQISQLTLLELQNTRAQTLSQLQSLEIQIRLLKAQLQSLVGLAPDGELTLSPRSRQRNYLKSISLKPLPSSILPVLGRLFWLQATCCTPLLLYRKMSWPTSVSCSITPPAGLWSWIWMPGEIWS